MKTAEDKILKKLNNHDKHFDLIEKKLMEHDDHFAEVDKKLDKHQVSLEKIVARTFDLEDKIDRVDSKIDEFKDDILSAIDSYAKKTTDVEIELLSTRATLDRHQDEIDLNKKDIAKVQKVLKIT